MSVHKSLKLKNQLVGRRNVLSREERLKYLQDAGEWKDGDRIYGLPKLFIKASGIVQVKTLEEKNPKPTATAAPVAAVVDPKKKKK